MKTLLNAIKKVVKTAVQVVKDSIRIVIESVLGTFVVGSLVASAPIPLLGVVTNVPTNICVGLWLLFAVVAAVWMGSTLFTVGLYIAVLLVALNIISSVYDLCKS